jgi:hypothetical protein
MNNTTAPQEYTSSLDLYKRIAWLASSAPMTNFRLEKKSVGKVLTNFKIVDDKGAVYGSINVPNEAVSDLLKHWKETTPAPAAASKQSTAAAALSAAFKRAKQPRLSKRAILRGC